MLNHKIDIITIAYDLDYRTHSNFIGSLLDTGFSGNVYIASGASDKPVIDKIVKTYPNKNIYYIIGDKPNYNITTQKFFLYDKFIENIKSDYLFVCDFSDVFFQENIENYKYDPEVDIYGFLENNTILNDKTYTSQWIKWTEELLNISIYDQIKNDMVICSGTTLGKTHVVKLYLKEMLRILQLTTEYLRWRAYDQGVHNYIFRCSFKDKYNIKLLDNTNNLVCTMGHDNKKEFLGTKVINKNKELYYVLHQYNRMSKSDQNILPLSTGNFGTPTRLF